MDSRGGRHRPPSRMLSAFALVADPEPATLLGGCRHFSHSTPPSVYRADFVSEARTQKVRLRLEGLHDGVSVGLRRSEGLVSWRTRHGCDHHPCCASHDPRARRVRARYQAAPMRWWVASAAPARGGPGPLHGVPRPSTSSPRSRRSTPGEHGTGMGDLVGIQLGSQSANQPAGSDHSNWPIGSAARQMVGSQKEILGHRGQSAPSTNGSSAARGLLGAIEVAIHGSQKPAEGGSHHCSSTVSPRQKVQRSRRSVLAPEADGGELGGEDAESVRLTNGATQLKKRARTFARPWTYPPRRGPSQRRYTS